MHYTCHKCRNSVLDYNTLEMSINGEQNRWCYTCVDRHLRICQRCSLYKNKEDVERVGSPAFWSCKTCQTRYKPCENCSKEKVWERYCSQCSPFFTQQDYCYKPSPNFMGKGPLYFGVELEIEHSNRDKKILDTDDIKDIIHHRFSCSEDKKYLYCKHDGSLTNGFEIVSHPADWSWLVKNKRKWESLLDLIKDREYKSMRTCGMHIHITRKALKPLDLYKVQKIVYENPEWWQKVAERSSSYAKLDPSSHSYEEALAVAQNGCTHKYSAIHLTNTTIEFRIFSSTLEFPNFWKNLESVKALCFFAQETAVKDCSCETFYQFCVKKSRYLPFFSKWCKDHPIKTKSRVVFPKAQEYSPANTEISAHYEEF